MTGIVYQAGREGRVWLGDGPPPPAWVARERKRDLAPRGERAGEFRFDHDELARIARHWRIAWPILVMRKRYKRWTGSHTLWPSQDPGPRGVPLHVIRVANGDLHQMLATLAHEFEHAKQVERLTPAGFEFAYRSDPLRMEDQAKRAEKRWAEFLPAIRPTRGVSLSQLLHDHHDEGSTECPRT